MVMPIVDRSTPLLHIGRNWHGIVGLFLHFFPSVNCEQLDHGIGTYIIKVMLNSKIVASIF
jgi:hypothetical protein